VLVLIDISLVTGFRCVSLFLLFADCFFVFFLCCGFFFWSSALCRKEVCSLTQSESLGNYSLSRGASVDSGALVELDFSHGTAKTATRQAAKTSPKSASFMMNLFWSVEVNCEWKEPKFPSFYSRWSRAKSSTMSKFFCFRLVEHPR
jgi:hypothetical protein